jgi:hypothetical protein
MPVLGSQVSFSPSHQFQHTWTTGDFTTCEVVTACNNQGKLESKEIAA